MTSRVLAFVPSLRTGGARRTDLVIGVLVTLWLVFAALPGAAAELQLPDGCSDIAGACDNSAATIRVLAGHMPAITDRVAIRVPSEAGCKPVVVCRVPAGQEPCHGCYDGLTSAALWLPRRDCARDNWCAAIPAVLPTPTSDVPPPEEQDSLFDPPPPATTVPSSTLPTPVATPTPRPTAVWIASPSPLPTPLPDITPLTILTPPRCLVLVLVGLGVFTIIYGLQLAIMRRLRR